MQSFSLLVNNLEGDQNRADSNYACAIVLKIVSMGSEDELNAYEELRRKNVERNANVMRLLGLPISR